MVLRNVQLVAPDWCKSLEENRSSERRPDFEMSAKMFWVTKGKFNPPRSQLCKENTFTGALSHGARRSGLPPSVNWPHRPRTTLLALRDKPNKN